MMTRDGKLLIGDSPLRPQIEEKVNRLGLAARTTIGPQPEITLGMIGAMDVFVLPSFTEQRKLSPQRALAQLVQHPFNMRASRQRLQEIYES
jgi:hypothetical protein